MCNRPLFPFSSFQPFTRSCAFTSTLLFLRSSPAFAATLIYLCYIFLSLFSLCHSRSIACCRPSVFPFRLSFEPLLFDAHRLCAAALPLRAPLLRSVCATQGQPLPLSRTHMHACSRIYLCTSTLSFAIVLSPPFCVRYASRIHSTLVAVVFDRRS